MTINIVMEKRFSNLVNDFSQGNKNLVQKLIEDRPLIYKITGMGKPYIMVDYIRKTPQSVEQYNLSVRESLDESIALQMFPGYMMRR